MVMPVIEEISKMSNNDCDDDVLMNTRECELNRDKYKEPKKHNYYFCIDCNKGMLIDNQYFSLYKLWFMRVLPSIYKII